MNMYNLSTKKISRLVESGSARFQKSAIRTSSFTHLKLGLLYINYDDAKTIASNFKCENFGLIEYVLEKPSGLRWSRENVVYSRMLPTVHDLVKNSL
jgi:hypothetical protein